LSQKLYECMFLLDSGKYATDPQGTEGTLRETLERCGAEIVSSGPWQDGKLAYPIDGHKKGLHYLIYFKMDGSQVDEFTRLCHLNELVIRHLLIQQHDKLFDMMSHALAEHSTGGSASARAEEAPPAAAASVAVAT
jgi:small subunit ribosomal protein S6